MKCLDLKAQSMTAMRPTLLGKAKSLRSHRMTVRHFLLEEALQRCAVIRKTVFTLLERFCVTIIRYFAVVPLAFFLRLNQFRLIATWLDMCGTVKVFFLQEQLFSYPPVVNPVLANQRHRCFFPLHPKRYPTTHLLLSLPLIIVVCRVQHTVPSWPIE